MLEKPFSPFGTLVTRREKRQPVNCKSLEIYLLPVEKHLLLEGKHLSPEEKRLLLKGRCLSSLENLLSLMESLLSLMEKHLLI
jgi:hypothetical protein